MRYYDIETHSALLSLCEGNPPVTGGFPPQRDSQCFLDSRRSCWTISHVTGGLSLHDAYWRQSYDIQHTMSRWNSWKFSPHNCDTNYHTPQQLYTQLAHFMPCCYFIPVVFTRILQGYFMDSGAIMRLPQCQWVDPDSHMSSRLRYDNPNHSTAGLAILCWYSIQWNLSITTTQWDTALPSGAHLGGQGPPRWAPEGRNCQ